MCQAKTRSGGGGGRVLGYSLVILLYSRHIEWRRYNGIEVLLCSVCARILCTNQLCTNIVFPVVALAYHFTFWIGVRAT